MVMKYVWGILDLEGKNIQQTNVSYGNLFFFSTENIQLFRNWKSAKSITCAPQL